MDFGNDFNFDTFFKFFQQSAWQRKYPNFASYPKLIQECLELNERLQSIGT
jgi:hypothetical protein